jgi:hypothetical protein
MMGLAHASSTAFFLGIIVFCVVSVLFTIRDRRR